MRSPRTVDEIGPQKGPQTEFLTNPADIIIYGGEAGGGKTFGILLDPLRFVHIRGYGAVMFRRESSQITNEGGPWDTAQGLYSHLNVDFVSSPKHTARFKKYGTKLTFSHMQHEKHMRQWDGSQIVGVLFDELQHFTAKQFWYMLSRNRSTCPVRPYVKATCNPDPDSFLRDLLSWWIYQNWKDIPEDLKKEGVEPGDPIKARSGVIRWFVRKDGIVHWADTREELIERFGIKERPKSFTFIMSSLKDNPALIEADPDYEANIEALLDYEKKRLKGNWFARPTAGELFKRQNFEILDEIIEDNILNTIRYWDRAATEPNEENEDPDWTVGLKMVEMAEGYYVVTDVSRDRLDPGDVEELIDYNVQLDGEDCVLGLEQEPGASGKKEVYDYEKKYSNVVDIHIANKTKSKLTCWKPAARASKRKEIKLLRAGWNTALLNELEAVTDGTQEGHDDQADCLAGAYLYLSEGSFGVADGVDVV